MTEESRDTHNVLNINLPSLQGQFQASLQRLLDTVSFCFSGHQIIDENTFTSFAPFKRFEIASNVRLDFATLRDETHLWLLKNFLVEAVDLTSNFLEEVRFVCGIFNLAQHQPFKGAELEVLRTAEAKKFHRLGLPNKFEFLQSEFGIQSVWSSHVLSINKARNCLVHRKGIVAQQDLNEPDSLVITWRTIDLIAKSESGEEITISAPGHNVRDPSTVYIKSHDVHKRFKVGERIVLSYEELYKTLVTLFVFCTDLVKSVTDYNNRLELPTQVNGTDG